MVLVLIYPNIMKNSLKNNLYLNEDFTYLKIIILLKLDII